MVSRAWTTKCNLSLSQELGSDEGMSSGVMFNQLGGGDCLVFVGTFQ